MSEQTEVSFDTALMMALHRNVLVALIASQCGGVKMNVMKHHSRLQACSSWQDQSGNLKVYGEIGLLERGKAVSFLI